MIYIVICGTYEDTHNEFVTTDIDKAVQHALLVYPYKGRTDKVTPYWNTISGIEVWNDGKLICEYGNMTHKITTHQPLTHEELKADLIKAIKEAEENK